MSRRELHPLMYEIEYRASLLQKRLRNTEIRPEGLSNPICNPWLGIAPAQLQERPAVGPYPKSILFLCSDNLTRGPLAEALFVRLLFERNMEDQWFVRSGGVDILNDEVLPIDERVVKYLAVKNIFPGLHQSRTVTRSDFTRFNIIVCFDEVERGFAKELSPKSCIQRIKLLGKFHPSGKLNFIGSKNKELPESNNWISCREWRETRTTTKSTIEPKDLEDIAILYEQCYLCCSRILDYHLQKAFPLCMCIYECEPKQFEPYNPDKIFSGPPDNIRNVIEEEDDGDMEITGRTKDMRNYYANNQICQACWKKIPPKNLNDGASSSKTT